MPNNYYAKELKKCVTVSDVERLFIEAKFTNRGESNFFAESVTLIDSGNIFTNAKVKVEGFLGLLFRVILFLKLDGQIGNKPQNSGEATFFSSLSTLFVDMKSLKNITRIEDFDSNLLDSYILLQLEKKHKIRTIMIKIKSTFEIIYYMKNLRLPYFLCFDENVLTDSEEYKKLEKLSRKESREVQLIANAKKPYPLDKLKIIISKSMQFIEKYSDEVLEVARHFITTKEDSQYGKYSKTYDFFKETDIKFSEPRLNTLQKKILISGTKYINDGQNLGRNPDIGKSRSILFGVIEEFEISCITIALMMTGMRVGELCTLDRNLKITQDEHYYLERIVYKTASTENGETLEMPIPKICKRALELLSKIASMKDNNKNKSLILSSFSGSKVMPVRTSRINQMLNKYCKKLGFDKAIEVHQFRHAMAFLITHIHESEGLELARMFLGHTSITMTLQYMGNFNNEIKEAIVELQKEESEQLVGVIVEQIQNNKKLFGENGKRLMPRNKFVGQQVDEFIKLMRKGLLKLVEEQKLAIIQTPVSLCIHDLSKPESLACQAGFDIKEVVASGPAPSRCKGANCANALFFEEHVEKLKNNMYADIDSGLRERLEQNTYFMDAGGFEQDPFKRIIKEYDEYKKKASNG